MGYQLPLRFIRVSKRENSNLQTDVAICATRIVAMMSTDSFQARETIKNERQAGTLINAAGREKVQTAIFLDNGSVIASPLSVRRLMNSIEKANNKELGKSAPQIARMKVYDVYDEEPNEELDENISDLSAFYDEEDEDNDND